MKMTMTQVEDRESKHQTSKGGTQEEEKLKEGLQAQHRTEGKETYGEKQHFVSLKQKLHIRLHLLQTLLNYIHAGRDSRV